LRGAQSIALFQLMEARVARPGASDAELAAITRRLEALAAGVSQSGPAGGGSDRPASRGRVRFDAGAPAAPQQRSRTRSRSRSRSRSVSRARIARGGEGGRGEESEEEGSGTPRRTSLFAEAAASRAPRGGSFEPDSPPGRGGGAGDGRFAGVSLYGAAEDGAGVGVEARLRASAAAQAADGVAARRDAARDAAAGAGALRRAAPAAAAAALRRSSGAAPPVSYDPTGGQGATLPQTAPDRAAALGQALAEIVRARNTTFVAPPPGTAGGADGGAGASAAAWSARLATLRGGEYNSGPPRGAAAVQQDAKQLDSALDEQGKFRPNAAAQAAREEQWAATAAGSSASYAARRAALAAANPSGGGSGGQRSTSRGRNAQEPASGGATSMIRRTASRDAVESAGVSVVRALSGAPTAASPAQRSRPASEENAVIEAPAPAPAPPPRAAPAAAAVSPAPVVRSPAPRTPVPAAPTPTGENFPLYYNADPAATGPPLPPLGGGVGVADGGQMRLVAGYADGSLRVWRASDGAMLARVRRAHAGPVRAAAVLAGGAVLVTAGDNVPAPGQAKPRLAGALGDDDEEDDLARSPDAGPAPRGALRVWTLHPQSVQLCAMLMPNGPESGGAVTTMAVLDARRLAVATDAGNVAIWNVPGRTCDLVLRGASGGVHVLAALPSAELAAAGEDCIVRIYGTWDGALEHELHGHQAQVTALCPLEGGVQLVSGDSGGALRIWHVEEGLCLATIKAAHCPDRVVALGELGDGRLASAGSDGLLSLWVRPKQGLREVATRWVAAGAAGQRRLGAATPAGPTAVLRLGTTAHAAAACGDGTLRLFRCGDGEAVAMLLPDDVAESGDESYAQHDVATALTALALAGGAPPASDAAPSRAACAPRVRDRLWCFNGRMC
jgi:hypothetical protein